MTPPTRKSGRRPATWKIQASMAVVVVLPCVPATTIDVCPGIKYSSRSCGIEQYGIFSSRMYSISGFPRATIFPTTARSGAGCKFSSRNPSFQRMPNESSKVEAGGYTFTSEPVTRKPRSLSIPATGAIAEPEMPNTCTRSGFCPTIPTSPIIAVLRCARRLQNFECCASTIRVVRSQARAHAKRQSQHWPRCVTNRRAPNNRKLEKLQNPLRHIPYRLCSRRTFALGEFSEHHAGNSSEFARLFQMHERAINLPGLHAPVLKHENGTMRVEFP